MIVCDEAAACGLHVLGTEGGSGAAGAEDEDVGLCALRRPLGMAILRGGGGVGRLVEF